MYKTLEFKEGVLSFFHDCTYNNNNNYINTRFKTIRIINTTLLRQCFTIEVL